jgi:hypothetical protein
MGSRRRNHKIIENYACLCGHFGLSYGVTSFGRATRGGPETLNSKGEFMKRKYLIIPLLMIVGLVIFGCSNDNITEPDFYDNQRIDLRIPVSQDSVFIHYQVYYWGEFNVYIFRNTGECIYYSAESNYWLGFNGFFWNLRDNNLNRVDKGIYRFVESAGDNQHCQWLEIY